MLNINVNPVQLKFLDRDYIVGKGGKFNSSRACFYGKNGFVGKAFGKRPLVPRISPKKTYEGLFGAILGSMMVIILSHRVMGVGILESVLLGGIIGMLAQIGDVFESVGKRICDVKDSSSLIPGHGGILDRIDSFIFTTPFIYHYLTGIKG